MASTSVSVSGPRRSATSNSRETFSRAAAVPPAITMPAMRRAAVASTASRETNAQSPSPSSIGIASLTTPYPAGCSRYSRVKNCQIACAVDSEPPRSTITGRWASADPATIAAKASSAQSRERQLAERSHRTWTAVQGQEQQQHQRLEEPASERQPEDGVGKANDWAERREHEQRFKRPEQ